MVHGPAFLIAALHEQLGLSLAEAGLVAAAPMVGVMVALVPWGIVTDRRGERLVLLVGLVGAAVLGAGAALSDSVVMLALGLGLAGLAAASSNVASGRVVVGWFPAGRRGLAMGIRQMAQPVGVGVAAATMAVVADRHGPYAAVWIPVVACALAAVLVAVVVVDPPRPASGPTAAPNPYRGDRYLYRIHGVSVLLVVPQFVVWTFALVWLVQDRGWSPGCGRRARGRCPGGRRARPDRGRPAVRHGGQPDAAAALGDGRGRGHDAAARCDGRVEGSVAVPLVVLATVVTVADNGLAFTAVAERAGPFWSGRALGVQNTAQFLAAAAVPPLAGLTVAGLGYPAMFALAAVFPLTALALVPVRDERALS